MKHWNFLGAPHEEPAFESSADPILLAFGALFVDAGLEAFDADKHLRSDAFEPIYDCATVAHRDTTAPAEPFVAIWSPVWEGQDPLTGFRTGRDSVWLGSTPTVAMPQDERTAALLLLVTSAFVHLSAGWDGSRLVVRGAVEQYGAGYRYVMLEPVDEAATAARDHPGAPADQGTSPRTTLARQPSRRATVSS